MISVLTVFTFNGFWMASRLHCSLASVIKKLRTTMNLVRQEMMVGQ